jgi:hypothetical protein
VSVCFSQLPSSALYSSTTPTATVETTAPMREVSCQFLRFHVSEFSHPFLHWIRHISLSVVTLIFPTNPTLAFLSYLRLSMYMSIVSIAIVMSFHLKNKPTKNELRMALPLGVVFWGLALSCLALGVGNYIKTVTKYSRRMALVQTGWKTQVVSY